MFTDDLGVNIIQTLDGSNIIGHVYLNKNIGMLKITNPFELFSKSIKETGSKETFSLNLRTISEFSDGEDIIISHTGYVSILRPKDELISEYNRISESIVEYRKDYNNIDMENIINENTPDMNSYYGKSSNASDDGKNVKNHWIKRRWLDK